MYVNVKFDIFYVILAPKEIIMDWKPYAVENAIGITEMFSFFTYNYKSSYKYAGETHNFWECVYVLKGSICVSADERIYNLSQGEMIFHKPYEFHKFHITDKSGATLLIFSFSATGSLCSFFENKVFSLNGQQREMLEELIAFAKKTAPRNDDSYKMYLHEFKKSKTYSQNVTISICRLFLSLFENGNTLSSYKSDDAQVFEKTIKYMRSKIYENPAVDEFAQNANISVSGLKRIFQRYTGIGIHKYFLKIKLQEAAFLIGAGFSVTETAEKLSFSSQGYFTKSFKRELGYLPSEIKNNS